MSCSASGVPGVPGVPGLSGRDGAKGDQGPVGAPGKRGLKGALGDKGSQGPVGPPGKMGPQGSQGVKGEQGVSGVVPKRNWKQCTWKPLEEGKDYGLIKVSVLCLYKNFIILHYLCVAQFSLKSFKFSFYFEGLRLC